MKPPRNCTIEQLETRRLFAATALDPSFGTGGVVTTPLGQQVSGFRQIVGNNGNVLLAGVVDAGTNHTEVALLRYLPDGSLDSHFGKAGEVLSDFGDTDNNILSFIQRPSGKYLALVHLDKTQKDGAPTGGEFMVQYNSNGSADKTFNNGKPVVVSASRIGMTAIAVGPDNKITAVGSYTVAESQGPFPPSDVIVAGKADIELERFGPHGGLDPSFGNGGRLHEKGHATSSTQGIAISITGKAIVSEEQVSDFLCFTRQGKLDKTFGVNGVLGAKSAGVNSFSLLSNGDIVASNATSLNNSDDNATGYYVDRYLPNGTPDTPFGVNGEATITVQTNPQFEFQGPGYLSVSADGSIVVAASAGINTGPPSPWQFISMAMLDSTGQPLTSFGTNGQILENLPGGAGNINGIAMASNRVYAIADLATLNLLTIQYSDPSAIAVAAYKTGS